MADAEKMDLPLSGKAHNRLRELPESRRAENKDPRSCGDLTNLLHSGGYKDIR